MHLWPSIRVRKTVSNNLDLNDIRGTHYLDKSARLIIEDNGRVVRANNFYYENKVLERLPPSLIASYISFAFNNQ